MGAELGCSRCQRPGGLGCPLETIVQVIFNATSTITAHHRGVVGEGWACRTPQLQPRDVASNPRLYQRFFIHHVPATVLELCNRVNSSGTGLNWAAELGRAVVCALQLLDLGLAQLTGGDA